jgi:glycerol-3-phosphate dehydrogenase (NAD(P)+)
VIGVVGLGNWGTALAQHCSALGNKVIGWDRDRSVVNSINTNKCHSKYHEGISLNFDATDNIDECINSEFIILAVPSEALETIRLENIRKDSIIISAIKGFIGEKTPLQYLESKVSNSLCVLSGPSFAYDVIRGNPLGIVAGSKDVAEIVSTKFSGRGMRIYPSTDSLGVELGGALKNIIAIAAGVSDGLGYGDSTRAGIITRGLAEMIRLSSALGAKFETLCGLSGLGDLLMTASSPLSRNRTLGFRLGRGEKIQDINLGSVAEGIGTSKKALILGKKCGVELPITEQVVKLIEGEITPIEMEKNLLARALNKEF